MRIKWVDTAKGIAILMVVMGHICTLDGFAHKWIYSFHIAIFFILSGILMANNNIFEKSNKEILIKKVKGLLYPYLTFSILSLVINLLFMIAEKDYNILNIIKMLLHMCTFDGILTLWFLPALFIAELVFIYENIYFKKIYVLLFNIVLIVASSLFSRYLERDTEGIIITGLVFVFNIINRALVGSIFINFGYYVFKQKSFNTIINNRGICVFCGVVLFIVNLYVCRFNDGIDLHFSNLGNPVLFYITGILGSMAMIFLSVILSDRIKYITYCGVSSLLIFATHLNFKVILVSRKAINLVFSNYYINTVCVFILVMIIEMIIIRVINKYMPFIIKYNDLVKKIKRREH